MDPLNCKYAREQMLEAARPGAVLKPELETHLRACSACAEQLASLRQTMNVLAEWKAPEPSPYFDTRLAARLREADEAPLRTRMFHWLSWRPALAATLAIAMITGVRVYQQYTAPMEIAKGTAVADLQALDSNSDDYNNLDLLDDDSDQNNNQQAR